mmetsp:Transcript_23658/g.64175  ORF Transcript_23658/g.64175 Transcript_23658/m.64175 type:complete len:219 (+) Transcript_23658:1203-1859(+)
MDPSFRHGSVPTSGLGHTRGNLLLRRLSHPDWRGHFRGYVCCHFCHVHDGCGTGPVCTRRHRPAESGAGRVAHPRRDGPQLRARSRQRHGREPALCSRPRGVPQRPVLLSHAPRRHCVHGLLAHHRAGADRGPRRRQRLGQVHGRAAPRALLRPGWRHRAPGWHRSPPASVAVAAPAHWPGGAGACALRRHHRGEHRLRQARGDTGGGGGGRAHGQCP